MDDDLYILWLSRIDGLSTKKQLLVLSSFPLPKAVFNATKYQLSSVKGLNEADIESIIKAQDEKRLKEYERCLKEKRIDFIGINNEKYPALLRQIPEPPLGLYVIGTFPDDSLMRVSVIGSRKSSDYGLNVAYKLSRDLAQNQITIVSGMARGIDSMAHKGAMDGGGKTIAVLGCGVDICYPPENKALMERIKQNGCVISEHYPGTLPMPRHFPYRNRIISGLCAGTIVVEASDRSGTLITTNHALEQGREVMAVPGNVTSKLSKGTNALIKDGAAVVLDYIDVLNVLNIKVKDDKVDDNTPNTEAKENKADSTESKIKKTNNTSKSGKTNNKSKTNNNIPKYPSDLSPDEQLVYAELSDEQINIDELIQRVGDIEAGNVSSALTMLEIKGYARKTSGYNYVRI